jgi:putative restriction endonuclease
MPTAQPFIANTDWRWFQFLSQAGLPGLALDEANFWQPRAKRPMARMEPGTPVFFRLKSPRNVVAGYGFFAHFVLLGLRQAWEFFGDRNGDPDLESFLGRIGGYRGLDLVGDRTAPWDPIGCTVLRDCVFWPGNRWLPWGKEQGWAPNIVQGKAERDPVRASRLLAEIQYDSIDTPLELDAEPFVPLEVDERQVVLAKKLQRVGQGTFRSRLLDAYGRRCAITGEHTEIVLDAAHIQPYLGPASNHVQNGMLLTKEFHALFDAGYVTVTPDHIVRVSPRLREEWDNGVRYYPFDGKRLAVEPSGPWTPSKPALEWHGQKLFRS